MAETVSLRRREASDSGAPVLAVIVVQLAMLEHRSHGPVHASVLTSFSSPVPANNPPSDGRQPGKDTDRRDDGQSKNRYPSNQPPKNPRDGDDENRFYRPDSDRFNRQSEEWKRGYRAGYDYGYGRASYDCTHHQPGEPPQG